MNVRARASRLLGGTLLAAGLLGYPFAIASGLAHSSPRILGALLVGLTLVAALFFGRHTSALLPLLLRRFGLLLAVALTAAATDNPLALTLLPSLTSVWMLVVFASSLREERSIVEQFAVAMHDGFPDFLLPYCRRVTLLWCVFFALNALLGAALAVAAPSNVWAFYTGVVSYGLVVFLVVGEYVFHKSRFRFYEDGWADGLWRRLCPPERTALGRRTLNWQAARSRGNGGSPA